MDELSTAVAWRRNARVLFGWKAPSKLRRKFNCGSSN